MQNGFNPMQAVEEAIRNLYNNGDISPQAIGFDINGNRLFWDFIKENVNNVTMARRWGNGQDLNTRIGTVIKGCIAFYYMANNSQPPQQFMQAADILSKISKAAHSGFSQNHGGQVGYGFNNGGTTMHQNYRPMNAGFGNQSNIGYSMDGVKNAPIQNNMGGGMNMNVDGGSFGFNSGGGMSMSQQPTTPQVNYGQSVSATKATTITFDQEPKGPKEEPVKRKTYLSDEEKSPLLSATFTPEPMRGTTNPVITQEQVEESKAVEEEKPQMSIAELAAAARKNKPGVMSFGTKEPKVVEHKSPVVKNDIPEFPSDGTSEYNNADPMREAVIVEAEEREQARLSAQQAAEERAEAELLAEEAERAKQVEDESTTTVDVFNHIPDQQLDEELIAAVSGSIEDSDDGEEDEDGVTYTQLRNIISICTDVSEITKTMTREQILVSDELESLLNSLIEELS